MAVKEVGGEGQLHIVIQGGEGEGEVRSVEMRRVRAGVRYGSLNS